LCAKQTEGDEMIETQICLYIGIPAMVSVVFACLGEPDAGWNLKRVLLVLYWMQAVVWTLVQLGVVYRGEQPFSAIHACRDVYKREGIASALLCGYLYAAFYSLFFSIPFVTLHSIPSLQDRSTRVLVAIWVGLTLLIFGGAIFAFVRALPSVFVWVPWAFVTTFFLRAIWRINAEQKVRASDSAGE
jgi:hypothetical protein